MNKDNYTLLQIDTIKELANVGGGNAATSISQLIGKPVSMEVPTIEILNYNNVFNKIMPEDTLIDAIMMRMLGDAEGIYLFVTRPEASKALIQMMLPDFIKEKNEELNHSTLKELVNIVVSSYLNAISKMVNVNLISSVPSLSEDMFGAILSSAYIESEQYDENIMIIKNEFLYQGERIESSLYFIPKPGVLKKLFKILGV
ncbi:chemotaxis protein CheC [Alkalibaculum bacchi]|uniref:Chemotaxis protein CheC n=1 Tax=Alkalibaculum bacchi TaxID=645887 RepID=A0A366IFH7_9FIRM|nr:chemotaxis protein CheC [Alkalibaculum bacchi]RBP70132.1 chemotaxis protein CheC [Alkalibaculum bacchi]